MRVTTLVPIALAALALGACSQPRRGSGDGGGSGDAAGDGGTGVAPPAAPEPAALAPCPEGWSETGDPAVCAPWPDGADDACGPAEALFPGEAECAAVGSECPGDGWPADLPSGDVRWVRAGAPAGGDGSRSSPYARIADALAGASPDTVIALASGTYEEAPSLPAGVSLVGACPAETVVEAPTSSGDGVVMVGGGDVLVRDVTVTGPRAGVWLETGAAAELRGVVVRDVRFIGVAVNPDASLVADSLLVRGTAPRPSDGKFGRALEAAQRTTVRLSRVALESSTDTGLLAHGDGTELTGTAVVVRDVTAAPASDAGGAGLGAQTGATVELAASVIEGVTERGVLAGGGGVALSLDHVVVRDIAGIGDGVELGSGVQLLEGVSGTITRSRFARVAGAGLGISQGASLSLEDSVLDEAAESPDTRGLNVQRDAEVDVARVRLTAQRNIAVTVVERGTLRGTDVVIRDTRPAPDGGFGNGLNVQSGGRAELERVEIERAREAAIVVDDADASARLVDLLVRDMLPRAADDSNGRGLYAVDGAQVELERARFERVHEVALLAAAGGSSIVATDLHVRETLPRQTDQRAGRAIGVQLEASAEVTRGLFEDLRELGAYGAGSGATLTLEDVSIVDVAPSVCIDTSCPDDAAGIGVGTYDGASVAVRDFEIARAALCGVQLAGDGAGVDLANGEVAESVIGACVQVDGYDLDRLSDGVAYRDNGVNIDTTDLPVPDSAPPLPDE